MRIDGAGRSLRIGFEEELREPGAFGGVPGAVDHYGGLPVGVRARKRYRVVKGLLNRRR